MSKVVLDVSMSLDGFTAGYRVVAKRNDIPTSRFEEVDGHEKSTDKNAESSVT